MNLFDISMFQWYSNDIWNYYDVQWVQWYYYYCYIIICIISIFDRSQVGSLPPVLPVLKELRRGSWGPRGVYTMPKG